MTTLNATQLSALSRLFSSSVYREMAKKGRSPIFASLFSQTGLLSRSLMKKPVSAAFEAAFAVLRTSGIRDEYIYRSALTHNILLGRHSLKTASMLTEFRAGSCKADLAILNGTATVYEIKSDRDSLARLENQIENYRKVFAKVYVIAGEAHVDDVMTCIPGQVGVMSLVRWDRIRTVREAVNCSESVCPATIFESLRISEAKAILNNLGIVIPDMPNTMQWVSLRQLFAQLPPSVVHDQMVQVLRKTRTLVSLTNLIEELPHSLKPAALSISVGRADHQRLIQAIQTPINEALTWT